MAALPLEIPVSPMELPGLFDLDVDSLVDDTLANTGFLFDDYGGSVKMQNTEEKSPFHESDSGVSDTGSSSPFSETDIPMLDEMLENFVDPFLISGNKSDEEYLSSNICQAVSNEQTDDKPENMIDSQIGGRRTGLRSAVKAKKQEHQMTKTNRYHDSTSDDDCEIDSMDDTASRGKPKGSIRVKRAGEKLPSSDSSDKCSVTSVKVLRIVKSGSDNSTEDDVVKALEERNRKNAEMARQNRLKKKAYVGNLESEVEESRKKIDELESALNNAEEERDCYKREIEYLKSVLANQSALAGLLKNIPNVSGVTLSSSVSRKRVAELDHSYTPMKKGRSDASQTSSRSGVCLHVDSGSVSLEFCRRCSDMAKGGSH